MIQTILSPETSLRGASHPACVLAPDVTLVLVGDGTARLLDLGGNFYALSATAAAMLREALWTDLETAAARVAARYQVEEHEIQADLRALLEDLQRKGLIRRPGQARRRGACRRLLASLVLRPALCCLHAAPVSLWLKVKVLLGLAYLSLRLFGLAGTIAAWRRCRRPGGAAAGAGEEERAVHEVDEAVRAGAAGHLFNTECKERALCCWSLLGARGLPARLVLGVDLYPFSSHCWCDVNGRVLTDDEDHCRRYTPVLTYS
jgi:hypothetical protein